MSILTGCGTQPTVTVPEPQIYTALHLRALALADDPNKPATMNQNLRRHFGLTSTEYDQKKLRMDDMLDSHQRGSVYAQSIKTDLAADLTATLPKLPVDTDPKDPEPGQPAPGNSNNAANNDAGGNDNADDNAENDNSGGGSTSTPTTVAKLLEKVVDSIINNAAIADSPFDRLDRAVDFFAALIVKDLQTRGDSRLTDPNYLVAFLKGKNAIGQVRPNLDGRDESRLLMLYFQTSIDPGTTANQMVGLRLRVVKAELEEGEASATPERTWKDRGGKSGAKYVKVLRLHPTRNYDVENTFFGEAELQALSLKANVSAPLKAVDLKGSAQRQASLEAEARRRFLSRVGKSSSYINATTNTFGWNFYPSNVTVVRPNLGQWLFGWLIGTPRAYDTRALLEGGARDCTAIVLVPRKLKSITLRVDQIVRNIDTDYGGTVSDTRTNKRTATKREFTIVLPRFDDYEVEAAAMGVVTANTTTPYRGNMAIP